MFPKTCGPGGPSGAGAALGAEPIEMGEGWEMRVFFRSLWKVVCFSSSSYSPFFKKHHLILICGCGKGGELVGFHVSRGFFVCKALLGRLNGQVAVLVDFRFFLYKHNRNSNDI